MKTFKINIALNNGVENEFEIEYCTNGFTHNSKHHSLKITRKDEQAGLYPIKINGVEQKYGEDITIEIVGGLEISAFIALFQNDKLIPALIKQTIEHSYEMDEEIKQ